MQSNDLAFDPGIDEAIYQTLLDLVMRTSYQEERFAQLMISEEIPMDKPTIRAEIKKILSSDQPTILAMNFLVYWGCLLGSPDEETMLLLEEFGAEYERRKSLSSTASTEKILKRHGSLANIDEEEKPISSPFLMRRISLVNLLQRQMSPAKEDEDNIRAARVSKRSF